MNLKQVKKITDKGKSGGELKTVEFKTSTANLNSACQTLCGFLNQEGGIVLIGVKDDGRLIGQEITDRTRQEIAKEVRKFEPNPSIEVYYIPLENQKYIIAMKVSAGLHSPYTYDGRPYQRIESTTSVMSQHLYEQLLVKRGQLNHSWETFPTKEYTLEALDTQEIYKTVEDGIACGRLEKNVLSENLNDILMGLGLINNKLLTNAAVILFAKDLSSTYSQCEIKMARFVGNTTTKGFIDEKRCLGNAFRILEEGELFVRRHLNIAMGFSSDSFKRIEKPQLPLLAIREALINAICHRLCIA